MSFEVYDYHTTNRNVLITPEIRARLYHMKPGQVDSRHSHDLGHEVFLILEGQAEFEIGGTKKVLGPGEMCVALADEIHQVRNLLPDKPTIMYLSVTPHIQPTHTPRNGKNSHLPPRFRANSGYDVETDGSITREEMLERHLAAVQAMAEAAQRALATHRAMADKLCEAWNEDNEAVAEHARSAMWNSVYALYKRVYNLGETWNTLAPEAAAQE